MASNVQVNLERCNMIGHGKADQFQMGQSAFIYYLTCGVQGNFERCNMNGQGKASQLQIGQSAIMYCLTCGYFAFSVLSQFRYCFLHFWAVFKGQPHLTIPSPTAVFPVPALP